MLVASRRWNKAVVFLCLIATQQQEIGYTKKLQIKQFVLYVFDSCATTDDVRLHRNAKLVLYGCRYGYGAGAAANALTL